MKKCYIYTRVSTEMQTEGYSLEAQRDRILKHVNANDMVVVGEYSDVASGKNTKDRPYFEQMLKDIVSKKDKVDYVLVYKLSRFGRNAADAINSIQLMKDNGVSLWCVEDNIDSSNVNGKLMISVLSAVAEIERENILVQTMEGRNRKAREGRWNGGFAPYGYQLIDKELKIAEDEKEVIKIIYEKYAKENMGIGAIAKYLNTNGYVKKKRQNNTLETFSYSFVKGVLDNPVYKGYISYGRRKTVPIEGEHNKYHIVKQPKSAVVHYKGNHDAIISEELWNEVDEKRKQSGVKSIKTYSLDHANILSGILKCPLCGVGMYGNVNRKKKEEKDGTVTYYKDYFYYACKHRKQIDGHKCDYSHQIGQKIIDDAVAEVIIGLVKNPKFEVAIKEKINSKIDTKELEREFENLKKSLRQAIVSKDKIAVQMDALDVDDKFYHKKYEDLQKRLDSKYEEIGEFEYKIDEISSRIRNVEQQKITTDNIYKILLMFDKLYRKFTDIEKKEFISTFVEKVEIFPKKQPSGRLLKSIEFKFPVYFNDSEVIGLSWDNETTVECVVLMSRAEK